MPWHYALSDGAIVLVACWVIYYRRDMALAPRLAIGALGIAALIGSVRFGFGYHLELTDLHQGASKVAGLAAFSLLVFQLLTAEKSRSDRYGPLMLIATACFPIALLWPKLAAMTVVCLLVVACIVVLKRLLAGENGSGYLLMAFVVLLLDLLVVRRSPIVSESVAWHLYHVLIAVGLVLLTVGYKAGDPSQTRH